MRDLEWVGEDGEEETTHFHRRHAETGGLM